MGFSHVALAVAAEKGTETREEGLELYSLSLF